MESLLERVGITANKNAIPRDPESPVVTSGVRLGTPAITSRGMKENEMKTIARLIGRAVEERQNSLALVQVRRQVQELCTAFPLY